MMRYLAAAGVLFFSGVVALHAISAEHAIRAPLSFADQSAPPAALAIPANVKAEGLPPIPTSIPEALAPYSEARQALLLGWHPTRREILIRTTFGAVPHVHVVAGPGMDRRQMTFGRDRVSGGATYEPDGSHFVFQKDSGGGAETAQLFRYEVATGRTTLLTDGKSRNTSPAWSHRGGLMAFTSTRRNFKDRDIYVMNPADASSTRLVAQQEGVWYVLDWSPDDSEILAAQYVSGQQQFLWRVNVKTGEKAALTPRESNVQETWAAAQYAPNGTDIYAVSNRGSETSRVWRTSLPAGTWRPVTREEDAVESAALSPDGHTLAVVFDSPTASRVDLLDAKTGAVRVAAKLPPGVSLYGGGYPIPVPLWRPDGSEVGLAMWSLRSFGDVFSINAKTGAVDRWTKSELGAFNPESLPEAEIVSWKSFDGQTISGVLYRPPARFAGPRPVIINIHGGPLERERPRYQGRSAYFLNELGIAIVFPNVRGSKGFGKAFGDADNGEKREGAIKDIGALLDWIAAQPFLDKTRVLVTGGSYGGFLAYAAAETYGDRLRCAVAAAAISNFNTYFQGTDAGRVDIRRAEYGDERDPKMREFFERISPATNANRLKIPLFIVHGRKDSNVPVAQAEEMYRAAKANGAPAWMIVFEDEGHELNANAANNNFYFYAWIHFVKTFLVG